jgi:ATP-dependent Clp endopeptidase proteolytic subunit ClpP
MVIFNNDTQTEQEEEISEHQAAMVMAAMAGGPEGPEPNTLGLVGDLNEESAQELYHGLMQLNGGKVFPNPVGEGEERPEDVHLLISTGGGAVYDMFGIIDIMNIVKRRRDIATLGTGKVFSAGVPLLASGTKGKRFVTRNARIMMHRCSAGNMGTTADLKATHDEMRAMEDQMVQLIAENSKLSVGEIHNMFSRNTDEYFSAQEAIEMGLADEII